MKHFQKLIAIDFDGTITSGDNGSPTNIPPPRKGVIKTINAWYQEGYIITINTLRGDNGGPWEQAAREYLNKYEIPFHYFNENATERIDAYGDVRKIGADIYIDDRGIFGITEDFSDMYDIVKRQIGEPNKPSFTKRPDLTREDYMKTRYTASPWSPEFLKRKGESNLCNAIWNEIEGGYVNPHQMVENLSKQMERLQDQIQGYELAIATLKSKMPSA